MNPRNKILIALIFGSLVAVPILVSRVFQFLPFLEVTEPTRFQGIHLYATWKLFWQFRVLFLLYPTATKAETITFQTIANERHVAHHSDPSTLVRAKVKALLLLFVEGFFFIVPWDCPADFWDADSAFDRTMPFIIIDCFHLPGILRRTHSAARRRRPRVFVSYNPRDLVLGKRVRTIPVVATG